jgi:PTH1 family peptidyl-tRNA hydrolase
MNLSGDAVSLLARFYKIPSQDILVLHDEIELPLGKIVLKI